MCIPDLPDMYARSPRAAFFMPMLQPLHIFNNDDSSALGVETGPIKIAIAGIQHCEHRFITLLVYGFYIIKCTRSVIN